MQEYVKSVEIVKNKCKNGVDFTRRVIGEKEYMIRYIPKRLSDDYDAFCAFFGGLILNIFRRLRFA